jgi:hypothetical protein
MSSAKDLLIWKERTKSFAEEIKWRAEVWQWRAEMFESEYSCPYCSVPMKGRSCNVCEYEDSPLWACPKCDRELENGKCSGLAQW